MMRMPCLWNLFDKGNLFHYSTVESGSAVFGRVYEEPDNLVLTEFADLRCVARGH